MGLFLYWAFKGIDFDELWSSLRNLSLTWICLLVLTTLLTLVLRSWRWIVLMRPFASNITLRDATIALSIGYSSNIFILRSGEVLRALSLNWTQGARFGSVLATVIVERILDLVWLIFFVGISIFLLRERINQFYPWLEFFSLLGLALCIFALVFLVLVSIYRERALSYIERLAGKISLRLAKALVRIFETFVHGLTALHTPSAYLEIFVSSLMLNLGYILIIYESFLGFGFTRTHDTGLAAALVIMAISSIGMIFPTPGGTGSYHLFFGGGLMSLYSIPQVPALACATAVHAIATLTYLGIGGPALYLQWRTYKKKRGNLGEKLAR